MFNSFGIILITNTVYITILYIISTIVRYYVLSHIHKSPVNKKAVYDIRKYFNVLIIFTIVLLLHYLYFDEIDMFLITFFDIGVISLESFILVLSLISIITLTSFYNQASISKMSLSLVFYILIALLHTLALLQLLLRISPH